MVSTEVMVCNDWCVAYYNGTMVRESDKWPLPNTDHLCEELYGNSTSPHRMTGKVKRWCFCCAAKQMIFHICRPLTTSRYHTAHMCGYMVTFSIIASAAIKNRTTEGQNYNSLLNGNIICTSVTGYRYLWGLLTVKWTPFCTPIVQRLLAL